MDEENCECQKCQVVKKITRLLHSYQDMTPHQVFDCAFHAIIMMALNVGAANKMSFEESIITLDKIYKDCRDFVDKNAVWEPKSEV